MCENGEKYFRKNKHGEEDIFHHGSSRCHILMICRHFPPETGGTQVMAQKVVDFVKAKRPDVELHVVTLMPPLLDVDCPARENDGNVHIIRGKGVVDRFFTRVLENEKPGIAYYFAFLYFALLLGWIAMRYAREHCCEIDVIYGFGGMLPATVAVCMGGIFRKRVVNHYHIALASAPVLRITRGFTRWINNRAERIISYSSGALRSLVDVGVDRKKVVLIRNWVDTDIFCPVDSNTARKKLNLPADTFILLYVGRFMRSRGVERVASLMADFPDILFVFVGGFGDYADEMRVLSEKRVNMRVFPPQEHVALVDFYGAANMLAWVNTEGDAFGLATYECWSCGRPALVPAANPQFDPPMRLTDEAIRDVEGRLGILFEPDDESYRHAVRYAAAHEEHIAMMGGACRQYVVEHCGIKNAEKIFEILAGKRKTES